MQENDSVMCGYFCNGFIDFILASKNWLILQIYFLLMFLKKRWYNFVIFRKWIFQKWRKVILSNQLTKQVYLNKQNFIYKYCWITSEWNSKWKFYFNFFSNNRNSSKLLNVKRSKKKKHDKVLILAKSKLNSIEKLISQALIHMEIGHEEYITILNEKDKYEKMKDNLRSESEKYKIMRLSSTCQRHWLQRNV